MADKKITVVYLFNRVRQRAHEAIEQGKDHDNHFFGMYRLSPFGFQGKYLELEQFLPSGFCRFIRQHLLSIHFVHLPAIYSIFKADVVFTSTAFGTLALRSLWPFKKPRWVIFDFNLLAILGKRKTWKQKFLGFMISRVAGVITLSKGAVSIFQKNFPELADRVKFIPLGTDGEYFKPRFELEQEGVILSVGRDPGRDFSTLFSTVSSLKAKVFVTAKPRALEKHRPLPDNVEVKDFSPNELRDAYAEASLVVLPLGIKEDNYYDAMGCSTLVEAMAMGKAVVATRSATTESYITSGINGILVPSGDSLAMRDAIDSLLGNPEERKRLGIEARRFVEQNCAAEIYAKNLADYFNNILEL